MPVLGRAMFAYRGFHGLVKAKTVIGLAAGVLGLSGFSTVAAAESGACELDRPVRFVAINADSSRVLLELERFIVEQGYECKTEALELTLSEGVEALSRKQADIYTEVWLNSVSMQWQEAESSAKVLRLGELYLGGAKAFVSSSVLEAVEQAQEQNQVVDECAEGVSCSEDPLAYPDYAVFTGLQPQFSEQAPQISAFLANVRIQPELMKGLLDTMQKQELSARELAFQFLNDYEDVWTQWIPREVSLRVKAAL